MNNKILTTALVISCIGSHTFAAWSGKKEESVDLSPEATARWVTSHTDPRTKKKYTFNTDFGQVRATGRDKSRHKQNGTIPFRITGDLMQLKEVRGRTFHKREMGTVNIIIRDIDGKELFSKKVSLAKFCPS